MELTGIIILIFVIGGFFIGCFESDFFEGLLVSLLGFIIGGLMSLAICGLIAPMIAECTNAETKAEVYSVQELAALKDNTGIYGDFFLGCGTVESTQYIYYIVYEEGKGYCTNKTSASYAYIDYLNREGCEYDKPVKVIYQKDYASPFWRFITWRTADWTTFYVPEGSILENYYSIDLE